MAIIGAPKSWDVTPRTTLDENKTMSKGVRREGVNGSKGDFPHGSTGRNHISEIDRDRDPVGPSLAPRHVGRIGLPRVEVVGHDPSGSGKWLSPSFDKNLIGNAIQSHDPLKPQGQAHSASGGKFGKPSKVPMGKADSYRTRMDAGALAGESGGRDSYTGGRGRIKP